MDNYEDTNSVDLTEDEDSRDTIIASSDDNFEQRTTYYTGNNSSMQRLPVSSPPPLTPIPRFSSPGKLPIDQLHSVPMLRKIRKPSSTPQRSPAKGVTLISSTVVKPASSDSTISLDSDDEDVRMFQDKYENLEIQKTSVTSTVNSSVSQRPPGKVVVIKKNNKVYKVIIPHNVMPTPNQVGGPVLINIPEIGPLVIRIDPDAKTHGTQLKPFSLNFDEILKKSSIKSPVDKNIHSTPNKASDMLRKTSFELVPNKEALLSDPRFCWSFKRMKQRKKGLFLPSDIFGFTKTDSRQVSKCHRILDSIVIKKQLELRLMMASFEKLKEKTNKKHCIKPVKISEIVGDSMEDKLFEKNKEQTPKHYPDSINCTSQPIKRYDIHNLRLPPNTMITHLNGYDDLLMTRKVVILNDDHKEMSEQNIITTRNDFVQNRYKARRKSRAGQRRKEKKLLSMKTLNNLNEKSQEFMNIVKPCYVKMLRESHIDKMYRDVGNSSNTNSVSSSRYKSPPKSAVRKCNTVWVINMFMSKLIDNEQKFRTEMAFIKPVLVINEFNFTIVKFASEFSKSNIVVAVNKFRQFPEAFLKNNVFIEAVDIGYVKLIDSDILCRYLLGEIGPQSPQKINV